MNDATSVSIEPGWYVVNDNVMGGRSEGDFSIDDGIVRFTGRTNTNGGGFSSIRTEALQLDLSDQSGLQLRVRADGRRYTWRLTTDARWRGRQVAYWADFNTSSGSWSDVRIPFSQFVPRFRGYQLDGPALDPGKISGMGLMIYDNEDGPFELQLAGIQAYSAAAPFSLRQYRWKKRVLVLSAAADDEQFRNQQKALALSIDEFEDRDLLLVTLLDEEQSTAGTRELDPAEVTATREALGIPPGLFALRLIGKDGSVKLSSESATPMEDIYALIDTMPMRRAEQRENR